MNITIENISYIAKIVISTANRSYIRSVDLLEKTIKFNYKIILGVSIENRDF